MALLQTFDGKLEKIAFQKLLFLTTKKQKEPVYDFVPFLYGSYSISANADLGAMARNGLVVEDSKYVCKADKTNYISQLSAEDQIILVNLRSQYVKPDSNLLMRHTYLKFNYYAINSRIAKNILSKEEYEKLEFAKPKSDKTILFTIGYEGISFEEYLNRLIKNDVKTLVDVRNNPVSMKFGFSKKTLKLFCENLNIEYIHIPEVGIKSEFRQSLKDQSDYDNLFEGYKQKTLKETKAYQQKILGILKNKRRIALTCFESDVFKCHRSCLAESIIKTSEWKFELKHI